MSTWKIFSDAGNNFRWEMADQELQKEQPRDDVSQHHMDARYLPSMADLLLLGCSKLMGNENGNLEDPPMFRTGLGNSVAVKQSSIAKARSVLGDLDDAPADRGCLDEGKNGNTSFKPVFAVDSLTSASVLRSRMQNATDSAVNMSNSMFQTGSGKAVNISAAGLHRARTLLGLKENFDHESFHAVEEAQKHPASTELLAQENLSHSKFTSSTNVLTSIGVTSCGSESKNPDFENTSPEPSSVKFHTAGGRSISVSNDALQRARSLLGNLEFDNPINGTAGPVFSVVGDANPSCSENHNNGFTTPLLQNGIEDSDSSSRINTSPNRSHLHQKNQKQSLGKLVKIQPGNNLIRKFDAEAANHTPNQPYKSPTHDRMLVKTNSYVEKCDFSEHAVQPKIDLSKRSSNGALLDISNITSMDHMGNKQLFSEKRRSGRISSVPPFKKPRRSFVTPLKKNEYSAINVLDRLAPKDSCDKERISTRFPFQVPRPYLKEFLLQSPLHKRVVNLPDYVKRMNPFSAESYMFPNKTQADYIGSEAFFWMLSQSGASTQYLTKEWVSNHYKWIVWKLASYERCYPAKFSGKLLTISNVLEELRYRYEREVNHGHRSAIKKILDGDVPPSITMVLCISSFGENSDHRLGQESASLDENANDKAKKLELTDGWYSLKAVLDELLCQKLASGKLFLGQKLRICGAKLYGWHGPVSPFEASETTSLCLHINGTFRCHWAEKLGFCKSAPSSVALRCIKASGGAVPSTLVGVTRIYPVLYGERLSNGNFIVRPEREEAKALQLYNQRRDVVAEGIISAFQREAEFGADNDNESEEGAKIMKVLETAAEPEVLMAGMSSKQLTSFASYKAKLEAMKQSDMQKSIENAMEAAGLSQRDVTPFLRVKVVGLTNKCCPQANGPRKGLITIWNPTQKPILELCEGQAYAVGDLLPTSSDSGILYLQSRGSTSSWQPLSPSAMQNFMPFFTPRSSTTITSLGEIPLFGEFDLAALVVYVGEVYRHGHQQKQWVFVTDGSASEYCPNKSRDALLAINFCLPCTGSDLSAPVNPNIAESVVGFCNLTKKPRDQANGLWVAEATENSDYFLTYDHGGRRHLKDIAASVSKWANTSSLITQKHKETILSIIRNSRHSSLLT